MGILSICIYIETLPPLKRAVFIFWSKRTCNAVKWMQKLFSDLFSFWFCSQFSSLFNQPKIKEKMLSQNMYNVLKRIFEFMSIFVRFLVCEIWSILYSTVVNNEVVTCRDFCKRNSDANCRGWGFNSKATGVWGRRVVAPPQKRQF